MKNNQQFTKLCVEELSATRYAYKSALDDFNRRAKQHDDMIDFCNDYRKFLQACIDRVTKVLEAKL